MSDRQLITTRDGRYTPFQPGHTLGKNGRNKNPLTQIIISQLYEINPKTNKEKAHELVETLIRLAMGYTEKKYLKKKKGQKKRTIVETVYRPDFAAIKELLDRVDGKPMQNIEAKIDTRTEVIYRTADEIRAEFAKRGIQLSGDPLELTIDLDAEDITPES